MMAATVLASGVMELLNAPCERVTPNEVKLAAPGTKTASRKKKMDACITELGGASRQKGKSTYFKLADCAGEWCAGTFEHIADTLWAMHVAATDDILVNIFTQ